MVVHESIVCSEQLNRALFFRKILHVLQILQIFQHLLHVSTLSSGNCMILRSIFSHWGQLRDSNTTIKKGSTIALLIGYTVIFYYVLFKCILFNSLKLLFNDKNEIFTWIIFTITVFKNNNLLFSCSHARARTHTHTHTHTCFYPKRLTNEDIIEAIKTNKRLTFMPSQSCSP